MRCLRFQIPLILVFASFAMIFVSCGDKPDTTDSLPTPGSVNDRPGIIAKKIADLVVHSNGTVTHDGELFSGRAVELAEDGTRIRENHYWKGKKHGSFREFYTDGTPYRDIRFEDGIENGLGLEWDLEGNRTELFFENGVEVERYEPGVKAAE